MHLSFGFCGPLDLDFTQQNHSNQKWQEPTRRMAASAPMSLPAGSFGLFIFFIYWL
jgi:hypothetical protein